MAEAPSESQFKPGVAAIIIIAFGILILICLFIFAKRQIMRFAQKFSTDAPHAPIGYGAPKKLLQEIERRLTVVKEIKCEPKLMGPTNKYGCEENRDKYKHIYRMKAIDALPDLENELVKAFGDERIRRHPRADLRVYLLNLRKEGLPLFGCESKLINEFVECYTNARSDPIPDYGLEEYQQYMILMNKIKANIKYSSLTNKSSNVSKRQKGTFKSYTSSSPSKAS